MSCGDTQRPPASRPTTRFAPERTCPGGRPRSAASRRTRGVARAKSVGGLRYRQRNPGDEEVPMADVKPIPDGYPQVIPYLAVDGAAAAIEFYNTVLGTTERMRLPGPDGRIGHAEIELGDSVIMLADESPDIGAKSP